MAFRGKGQMNKHQISSIDEGFTQVRRMPTSARRYIAPRPGGVATTTADDILYETVDPVHRAIPRRRSAQAARTTQEEQEEMITSNAYNPPKRRLPDTDEVRITRPAARPPRMSRRRIIALVAGGVVSIFTAGGVFGSWANTAIKDFLHQYEEGINPAAQLSGIYGHHDSLAHPTIIEAYRTGDIISIVELPGGDEAHAHISQTAALRTIGYTGDLHKVYIQLYAERIEGKYQIRVHVECGGGLFSAPVIGDWLLIDKGDSFQAIQPEGV
jgi:hypothetical protein